MMNLSGASLKVGSCPYTQEVDLARKVCQCQTLYISLLCQLSLKFVGLCVRPEPTLVKHLKGAPLLFRLLALPTNIRLTGKA